MILLFYNFLFRLKVYFNFLKFRLSLFVALSSGFGYSFAVGKCNWDFFNFIILLIGGFCISGSSISLNQIIENNYDKIMHRTLLRPIPSNQLYLLESIIVTIIINIFGLLLLLFYTNILTTFLSFISMVMYSFIYTPLKRLSPISIFIGGLPGALPPLIGWLSVSNSISNEIFVIFILQFIWQFPHFWSIAWKSNYDYNLVGFRLLPNKGRKDFYTSIYIMVYSIILIPFILLPILIGVVEFNFLIISILYGFLFFNQTFFLIKNHSKRLVMKVMFGSFLYLPIMQIIFFLDRI
jgi:protoheme IX farnesyltransferase